MKKFVEDKQKEKAIYQRDTVLEAVRFAAEQFLVSMQWSDAIQDVIMKLGLATQVSRVYIFQNQTCHNGTLLTSQKHEWTAPGIIPQIDSPELQNFPYLAGGFSRWVEVMAKGNPVYGHVKDFPETEREILAQQSILSIVVVPIFVMGKWWGFMGFDECSKEREWTSIEIESLKTAANTLGAAINRYQIEEQMKLEVKHWHTTFDSITDLVSIHDKDFNLVRVNKAFADMVKKKCDELIGKKCYEVIHDAIEPWCECPNYETFKTGKPFTEEFFEPKLGKYLQVSTSPIFDKNGEICSSVHIAKDITERKRIESRIEQINRLKEALLSPCSLNEKLKLITDGIVAIFDADFARIWIVKPGDLCDSGCFHARATESPHICRERDRCLNLMASSGRYTHTDGEMHRRVPFGCYKIGRIIAGDKAKLITNDVKHDQHIHDHNWANKLGLLSFAGYRLLSEDREPIGVLALFSKHIFSPDDDSMLEGISNTTAQVIQTAKVEEALQAARADLEVKVKERTSELESAAELLKEEIHERQNMERELLFKTTLLQAQSESSIDGILVVDSGGKVISYNNRMREMWNIPQELWNTRIDEKLLQYAVTQLNEPEEFLQKVQYLYTNRWEKSRDEISLKDGRFFDRYSSPLVDAVGKYYGRVWYFRDITERKMMENQLRQTQKELKIYAEELMESNAALKALLKQREKDQREFEHNMLSNVKHLVLPYIAKLKRNRPASEELTYLNLLESNLKEIASPFSQKLSSKYLNFTQKEIQIADLIKDGKQDKDIMEILNISLDTVKTHRRNIRKKLGINNKKINLRTKLLSLT